MSHPYYEPAPQSPPPWPAQAPAPYRAPSRLLPILGVVLGSLGLIAGVAAWFRAAPAQPTYSNQQVADAKKAVCDAFTTAVNSFHVAGTQKAVDPTGKFLVAINARLAVIASGNYMRNEVEANPEAPKELRDLVNKLAKDYENIGLAQLAEESQRNVDVFGASADKAIPEINTMCQ